MSLSPITSNITGMTIHLKKLPPEALPSLRCFYKQAGYKGKVTLDDENWVLVDHAGQICAAARIVQQANERILRGVWVAAALQKQGLGRALLQQLADHGHLAQCITFPYRHLVRFYQSAGFVEVIAQPNLVPLLTRYNRHEERVILMRYMPT